MIAKERSAITELPLILRHGDPEQRPPVAAAEGHVGSLGGRSGTVEVADDDGIEARVQRFDPREDGSRSSSANILRDCSAFVISAIEQKVHSEADGAVGL